MSLLEGTVTDDILSRKLHNHVPGLSSEGHRQIFTRPCLYMDAHHIHISRENNEPIITVISIMLTNEVLIRPDQVLIGADPCYSPDQHLINT